MHKALIKSFLGGLLLAITIQMATAGTIAPSASASRNEFAARILTAIASDHTGENVIFSPASVQSCLAMAFLGAGGDTEKEMRHTLVLGVDAKPEIAKQYRDFIRTAFRNKSNGPEFKMANRIYMNERLQLNAAFNELAREYFDSEAESVPFDNAATVVPKINAWVEEQTNNKIQNLLSPDSVNGDTTALLVNAIYFKGKWKQQFSSSSTHKASFYINDTQKVEVDMMFSNEDYYYAEIPEMDATAIELPYENSELSMMIILPNQIDGLAKLESKLNCVDLNDIGLRFEMEDVEVFLPKFKIEFDIDLKKPLQKLGMTSAFGSQANFTGLFSSPVPQRISDVKHKAFLDVNEAGSEAAAASFLKVVPMSLNLQQKKFRANHPFVFAIRDSHAVYFAGHVAKF